MITYGDLADQILDKTRAGELLCCLNCDTECSANRGDYWNDADDSPIYCTCGKPMVLATKQTSLTIIKD